MLFIPLSIFGVCQVYAALNDARAMRIPNITSLFVLVAFALRVPAAWDGWGILSVHLAVGGLFFAAGFAMFAFGWLGGGDAKLMAATALFWTWPDAVTYIVYTTVLGGLLVLVLMVARNFVPVRIATHSLVAHMFREEKKVPYGIALAGGALLTLPTSDIVMRVFG